MNVNRILEVKDGNPVAAVREFLSAWWEVYSPEALLAPVDVSGGSLVEMKLLQDPQEVANVDPFLPLMPGNSAHAAIEYIQEHAGRRLAVVLRPCELRAYVELQKRQRRMARPNGAILIGVDCLGTYSKSDFKRVVEDRGPATVTGEALENAASGYRTACQICDWPAPVAADITLGTIGVNSKKILLLIARDEKVDAALGLERIAPEPATEYQVSHRETEVGAIASARAGVRKAMIEEVRDVRFDDLGSILAWFASCSLCGECLKACPLYDEEFAGLVNRRSAAPAAHTPLGDIVSLSRWLASCAGCGMCEEGCNMNVPLFLFISALSHRIREEMAYHSGDPTQPLPWLSA